MAITIPNIKAGTTSLAFSLQTGSAAVSGSGKTWHEAETDGFPTLGGQLTISAPTPISPSRSRKLGNVLDKDASVNYSQYFTFWNQQVILQGVMFDIMDRKGFASVTAVTTSGYTSTAAQITSFAGANIAFATGFSVASNNGYKLLTAATGTSASATGLVAETSTDGSLYAAGLQCVGGTASVTSIGGFATITVTGVDFVSMGIRVGQFIYVGGDSQSTQFSQAANNGWKRVRSVAATKLIVDKSASQMVAETPATGTTVQIFFGNTLKNGNTQTTINKMIYTYEQLLGSPDDANTQNQSQYVSGASVNEYTLSMSTADFIKTEISFIADDAQVRTQTQGPLQQGNVIVKPIAAAAMNTTSNVQFTWLSTVSATEELVTPLVARLTQTDLNINNNTQGNKAIGTLGAYASTDGVFAVQVSGAADIVTVDALSAINTSKEVTFSQAMVADNQGIVYDIPIGKLGDGSLSGENNSQVSMSYELQASEGLASNVDYTHTLMWSFFPYLPDRAATTV